MQLPRYTVNGESHQPLLVYIVNCWYKVQPRLMGLTAKANIMNDIIVFDLRTRRGTNLVPQEYPPDKVMEGATLVELEGIRKKLGEHPYLYNTAWCKQVSVAARKAVKQYKGEAGLYVLIAYGDTASHAPEGDEPVHNFAMHIATYFVRDLVNIAEHNLRGLQRDGKTDRQQAAIDNHNAAEKEARRLKIMADVEAAKRAREQAEAADIAEMRGGAAGSAHGVAGGGAGGSTQEDAEVTAGRRAMMMADLEAAKRARVAQAALMPLMEEDAEVKAVRRAENMAHVEAAKRAREEAEEEEARSAQQEAVAVGSVQEERPH